MADFSTFSMSNVLAGVDAIKTARLRQKVYGNALADRELEQQEKARARADEQALRAARTEAWQTGNVADLVGFAPGEAVAIKQQLLSMDAAERDREIASAREKMELGFKYLDWIEQGPDLAEKNRRVGIVRSAHPDMAEQIPEAYDPDVFGMAAAQFKGLDRIFTEAQLGRENDAMAGLAGAGAAAAPATAGRAPEQPWGRGAPPVGSQQPSSGPSRQAAHAYRRLVDQGMTPAQASGIVGNLMQESGSNLNASAWNADEEALGIAQWRGPRQAALVQFAKGRGTDARDFDTQLDFIVHELRGSESAAAQHLARATTPQEAAALFDQHYERSSGQHTERRAANAAAVHAAFGGEQVAQPGGGGGQELDPRVAALVALHGSLGADDPLRQEIGKRLMDYQGFGDQFTLSPGESRLDSAGGMIASLPPEAPRINYMGAVPPGYQAVTDPATGALSVVPIPGSPAAMEAQAAQSKLDTQQGRRDTSTETIVGAAQAARDLIGVMSTGLGGQVMGNLGQSDAAEVNRQVHVLKSIATIENLTAMRQASPTGGALGNVTNQEGTMLAAASGALDPTAGPQRFAQALDNYERTLLRIVHGPEEGDRLFAATRAEGGDGAGGFGAGVRPAAGGAGGGRRQGAGQDAGGESLGVILERYR